MKKDKKHQNLKTQIMFQDVFPYLLLYCNRLDVSLVKIMEEYMSGYFYNFIFKNLSVNLVHYYKNCDCQVFRYSCHLLSLSLEASNMEVRFWLQGSLVTLEEQEDSVTSHLWNWDWPSGSLGSAHLTSETTRNFYGIIIRNKILANDIFD